MSHTMNRGSGRSRAIALALLAALLLMGPGPARAALVCLAPAAKDAADTQATPPAALKIVILEGDEALNNVRDRTAREPIVQVEDENHKPVAGVLLLFSVHNGAGGAGATINGLSTATVTTDATGKAVLKGLSINQTSGAFTIEVTATLGTLTAAATIHESNVVPGSTETENSGGGGAPAPVKLHKGLKYGKYVGGIAVGGIVAGVILALRGHTTGISLGQGSVHP